MSRRHRTNVPSRNLLEWWTKSNQILSGCSPSKIQLSGPWLTPRKVYWIGVTVLSKFYHDGVLADVDLITLTFVHSWLECRLRWLPFKYAKMVSSISAILQGAGSVGASSDQTVLRLQTLLSATAVVAESPREYHSRLQTLSGLEKQGHIRLIFAPEGGIDEERSPRPPRIRGYRDKGTLRPAHKWLPSIYPDEEQIETSQNLASDNVAKLEDFLLLHRSD
jgi:hypothetical protein